MVHESHVFKHVLYVDVQECVRMIYKESQPNMNSFEDPGIQDLGMQERCKIQGHRIHDSGSRDSQSRDSRSRNSPDNIQ